ncbi:MAG: response regulator [Woeseiaceae bacterium]|nr:response regulator [Woeseiaceae bacterium]
MTHKVLFVDDEPNVLQSIRRSLRKQFDLDTAEGGEQALEMLAANGSYAIVVSDMRMPGMNGVELLSEAKKRFPDTVRMMLTGNADQQTAVDAVNHGDIFRFMNKPVQPDELASALNSGLRQHELITAEKELLQNTLRGSIKALADVLSLSNPDVFGRTTRFKTRISHTAEVMGLADVWQYESVAMLSQIGCVGVPVDLVRRKVGGHNLAREEMEEYAAHAAIGADLVKSIPRMETVAEAIRYQEKHFDGTGYPKDRVKGNDIPLAARLLKVVMDFDGLEAAGTPPDVAIERLKSQSQLYDPNVLAAFERSMQEDLELKSISVNIMQLTDDMVLAEDVKTADDTLLIAMGQETTLSARRHLQNYRDKGLIGNTVIVYENAG